MDSLASACPVYHVEMTESREFKGSKVLKIGWPVCLIGGDVTGQSSAWRSMLMILLSPQEQGILLAGNSVDYFN